MAALLIVVIVVVILILFRYQRGENYRREHPEQFSKEPNPEGMERMKKLDAKLDEAMRIAEMDKPSAREMEKKK